MGAVGLSPFVKVGKTLTHRLPELTLSGLFMTRLVGLAARPAYSDALHEASPITRAATRYERAAPTS